MTPFYKKIDKRCRKEMEAYLSEHFRYNTMNSWNNSTSYANNLKVYSLGLSSEIENKLYEMCQCKEFYWPINKLIRNFDKEYGFKWQAGFNGRSGGYLVLYQGYSESSGYKSYCRSCGQSNYKSIMESGTRCGKCGEKSRVDYVEPPMKTGTYPGRSTDQYEDFQDWTIEDLRDRVELVQSFDSLCDSIVCVAVETAESMIIEKYEDMVPVTRTRLVSVGAQ